MFSLPHHSPRDPHSAAGRPPSLFVDMQRAWVEPGREHVDPQGSRLLLRARAEPGDPQPAAPAQGHARSGRERPAHRHREPHRRWPRPLAGSCCRNAPGAADARVIDALEPTANEIVLPKTSSGVFNSTAIDYVLRNLGTRHLIVCGVVTDQCVDMAVRDAADRGYLVTLVEDACATHTRNATRPAWKRSRATAGSATPRPSCNASPPSAGATCEPPAAGTPGQLRHHRPGRHHPRALAAATLEEQLASGCGWVPANSSLTPQDLIDEQPLGQPRRPAPAARPEQPGARRAGSRRRCAALDSHGNLVETDGTPWPACPRGLLLAEVERYRDSGLQVIAAFEHEFSLLGLPGERPAAAFSLQAQRAAGQFPAGWSVPRPAGRSGPR